MNDTVTLHDAPPRCPRGHTVLTWTTQHRSLPVVHRHVVQNQIFRETLVQRDFQLSGDGALNVVERRRCEPEELDAMLEVSARCPHCGEPLTRRLFIHRGWWAS